MEFEKLNLAAQSVTMPEDMKQRITYNCKKQIKRIREDHSMPAIFRKYAAVFAALVIFFSLSVTVLADNDILQGLFRDIKNYTGAIVGTSYEQATDEIDICVSVKENQLTILAVFMDSDKFPYRDAETLSIADYTIEDTDGNIVKAGAVHEPSPVVDRQAAIILPLTELNEGAYKLTVNAFVSEKKADQPLEINGIWEAEFIK